MSEAIQQAEILEEHAVYLERLYGTADETVLVACKAGASALRQLVAQQEQIKTEDHGGTRLTAGDGVSVLVATWLPIESAPKDGTDVLLRIPDGRELPITGRWEPLVVSRKQKWCIDSGFLEDRFPLPTHWMPLPVPPPPVKETP